MKREELDGLLEELTHEDITTERQLDIFKLIQDNFDMQNETITNLTDSSAKLQEDYTKLKQKSVADFFRIGRESKEAEKEFKPEFEKADSEITIADLLEE